MKNKSQKNKGITLIALIITIIILLILAGVTMNLVIEDNGLINNSKNSKTKSEISQEKETIQLAINALKMNKEVDKIMATNIAEEINKEGKRVSAQGDYITFIKSKREYVITQDDGEIGINETQSTKVNDPTPGKLDYDSNTNSYTIYSIEDLVEFANKVNSGENFENATIYLGCSLDFYSRYSYALESSLKPGGLMEQVTSGEGFPTLGDYWYRVRDLTDYSFKDTFPITFKGTFNGKNNTISNMYINREMRVVRSNLDENKLLYEYYNTCLSFMGLNEGTIENLKMNSSHISGSGNATAIAINNNGRIKNIEISSLDIDTQNYAAGCSMQNVSNTSTIDSVTVKKGSKIKSNSGIACIVNYNLGTLSNSNNYADITQENSITYVAGIVSYNYPTGTVRKCSNYGNIIGEKFSNAFLGGISNINDGTITQCSNVGNLVQKGIRSYTGGLASRGSGTIELSNNKGDIIAAGSYCPRVGGLVGQGEGVNLINSYNIGNVDIVVPSTYTKVGGMIGESNDEDKITNCYNKGKITAIGSGYCFAGGLAGTCTTTTPTITNSYYLDTSAEKLNGNSTPPIINSTSKTQEEMTSKNSADFLDGINGDGAFKIDEKNINEGYPILVWESEE